MDQTPSASVSRTGSLSRSRSFPTLRKFLLVLPVLAFAMAGNAPAATDTWTGTLTSTDLNQPTWTPGPVTPTSGDSFIFTGANASLGTTLTDTLSGTFNLAGITYNSGALAYTLTGTSIVLTGGITNNSTNLQTINNALSAAAVQTFTLTSGGGNIALGGVFSGTGGITTAGTGTLVLSAVNLYTGNTSIGSGTTLGITGVGLLSSSTAGTYAGAIADNGTFNYGSSATQTLTGAISGTGAVTVSGNGTLIINNHVSTYGNLNVLSGTLQNSSTGETGTSTDLGTGTITLGSGLQ